MKKILMILCVVLSLSLVGCGEQKVVEEKEPAKEKVEKVEKEETKKPEETAKPEEKEQIKITIYVPDEAYMKLEEKEAKIDVLDPQLILDTLIDAQLLTDDCKVNGVTKENTTLYVDLNDGFQNLIRNMGTSGEYMIMGGVVNTYLDAYECEAVCITINGETFATGHAVYDGALTRFELEP